MAPKKEMFVMVDMKMWCNVFFRMLYKYINHEYIRGLRKNRSKTSKKSTDHSIFYVKLMWPKGCEPLNELPCCSRPYPQTWS